MGKFLVEFCTNCGLISFGLCGSLQRSKVGHQILWSGVEACEAALFFLLFEEMYSCTDFLGGVGREGRGRGHYLHKTLSFLKRDTF